MGCSWAPSPALTMLHLTVRESSAAAPAAGMADHDHIDAHRLDVAGGVDQRFALADAAALSREKSITSAESREAASEKLVRVRVLSSKKALTITRPRRAGTFFTLRVETSLNESAVSSTNRISSADSSSKPSRCLRVQRTGRSAVRCFRRQQSWLRLHRRFRPSHRFPQADVDPMIARHIAEGEADKIRLNRHLPPAAIHQHRQADRRWAGRNRSADPGAARIDRPVKITSSTSSSGLPSIAISSLRRATSGRGPISERSSR